MERTLGLQHPDTRDYTVRFAKALSHQNKTREAIEIVKGAEQRARKALGVDHPFTREYEKLLEDLEAPK